MQYAAQRLVIPVDISVRTGAFWATVVLLAGVLAGQIGRLVAEQRARSREGTTGPIKKWRNNEMGLADALKESWLLLWGSSGVPWLVIKTAFFVIVAVPVGLYTLYGGTQGATFGAAPVDYVSLFLWGFGADATTRGINKFFKS